MHGLILEAFWPYLVLESDTKIQLAVRCRSKAITVWDLLVCISIQSTKWILHKGDIFYLWLTYHVYFTKLS